MTDEPTSPGDGPSRNQPGTRSPLGTCTVPSRFSPRVDTGTDTSMAGIRSEVGTEWAKPWAGGAGGVVVVVETARWATGPANGC